jgi:DNA (cytosine-5)-methyltransferase 1
MVPAILCLNDQGGKHIDLSQNISGTLRADEHGHQPLVMATQQGGAEIGEGVCPTITSAAGASGNNQPVLYENHGIDSRYTGPHKVAPTMSARYGTGGNNQPLVAQPDEVICISGNTIDREPENGGNGLGCQPGIAYTLTGADRHAVYSRQRSDEFMKNEVTATQSARQHKDATDLVCQACVQKGTHPKLIRRLTPLECERLQGYPDGWTNIPDASDSARYKALGNSVAIPCVDFVLRGIAYFLRKIKKEKEENNLWDAGE